MSSEPSNPAEDRGRRSYGAKINEAITVETRSVLYWRELRKGIDKNERIYSSGSKRARDKACVMF